MKKDSKLHVYLMPGMAANPSIFEYIKLPEELFETHLLSWKIPIPKESLASYAARMLEEVKYENFALVGVSFGGILVQEMSKIKKPKRLIIISKNNEITVQDLPHEIIEKVNTEEDKLSEKEKIINSLKKSSGNKTKAAKILGISRKTLYNWINKYKDDKAAAEFVE